jgi:Signal recognition particle receptor beta subunit
MILAISLDAIKQFLELLPLAKGIVPVGTWILKNLIAFITIVLIIIVSISIFLAAEFLLSSQQFPGFRLLSILLAIFVGACTLLAALVFFKPVKDAFQQISLPVAPSPPIAPKNNTPDFNLVLYGLRGSGKTTLIKKLLTLDELGREPSTLESKIYTGQIKFDLTTDRAVNLRIADYYGEKPSRFLDMIKTEFTNSQGSSIVNAIIFVVDVAPRGLDLDGTIMTDAKLVAAMDGDKLTDRVAEHQDYISRSILEVLFSQIASSNLQSVRLLINKADLVEVFYGQNLGLSQTFSTPEAWARHLFEPIDASLKQACQSQNLDYSAVFTSLTQNPSIDFLKGLKGL